ncbi:unnamed protein product [Colias eurytheme]|nr:unnamed protein product [Colias eurytheme]
MFGIVLGECMLISMSIQSVFAGSCEVRVASRRLPSCEPPSPRHASLYRTTDSSSRHRVPNTAQTWRDIEKKPAVHGLKSDSASVCRKVFGKISLDLLNN